MVCGDKLGLTPTSSQCYLSRYVGLLTKFLLNLTPALAKSYRNRARIYGIVISHLGDREEDLDSNPEPPAPTPYRFSTEPPSCSVNCPSLVTAAIHVTTCPKKVGIQTPIATTVTRAISYYMLTVEEFFLLKDLEAERSGVGPVPRRSVALVLPLCVIQ